MQYLIFTKILEFTKNKHICLYLLSTLFETLNIPFLMESEI